MTAGMCATLNLEHLSHILSISAALDVTFFSVAISDPVLEFSLRLLCLMDRRDSMAVCKSAFFFIHFDSLIHSPLFFFLKPHRSAISFLAWTAKVLSEWYQAFLRIMSVRPHSVVLQPVSMIRQRILGVAGTYVLLSFLSHSSSKEYTCVIFTLLSLCLPAYPDLCPLSDSFSG